MQSLLRFFQVSVLRVKSQVVNRSAEKIKPRSSMLKDEEAKTLFHPATFATL